MVGAVSISARHTPSREAIGNEARRRNEIRHAHVLVVDEQRVSEVVRVLTERFAMIALDHDERAIVEVPRPQSVKELPQRGVAIVQRVEVAAEIARSFKRPRTGAGIRDDVPPPEDTSEKSLARLQRINPFEHALDRRRLVHTKARAHVAADRSGILRARRTRDLRSSAPCRDIRSAPSERAPSDTLPPPVFRRATCTEPAHGSPAAC